MDDVDSTVDDDDDDDDEFDSNQNLGWTTFFQLNNGSKWSTTLLVTLCVCY